MLYLCRDHPAARAGCTRLPRVLDLYPSSNPRQSGLRVAGQGQSFGEIRTPELRPGEGKEKRRRKGRGREGEGKEEGRRREGEGREKRRRREGEGKERGRRREGKGIRRFGLGGGRGGGDNRRSGASNPPSLEIVRDCQAESRHCSTPRLMLHATIAHSHPWRRLGKRAPAAELLRAWSKTC
jgi:hypothetical protein